MSTADNMPVRAPGKALISWENHEIENMSAD